VLSTVGVNSANKESPSDYTWETRKYNTAVQAISDALLL